MYLGRCTSRSRGTRSRLAPLVACLALLGCEPADPLAAIRQQQASGDLAGSIEPQAAFVVPTSSSWSAVFAQATD